MPELRRDPIIGRWVIVSVERSRRPNSFSSKKEPPELGDCPFCEGKESLTPPEIYALRKTGSKRNAPGWEVRVIPSKTPFLRIEGDLDRRGRGIYDVMNAVGAHEVIVETPQHIANMADLSQEQIARTIFTFAERSQDLEKDSRFKYALIFKNYKWSSGAGRINHSRSQLIATPVTPKRVKEELIGSRKYYEQHERCIFCDIVKQEIAMQKRVVFDSKDFIAIVPFAARAPFEMWILPKRHSCDFYNLSHEDCQSLAAILKKTLLTLKKGLEDPAYNIIIHTAPFRRKKARYWTTIEDDFHWHIELMPRLVNVAGFEWGTGFYICPIPPEDAAKYLRDTGI